MPEFKNPEPPKQPETKHNVPAAEFINAVKGLAFAGDNGLYRLKGKEIDLKKLFDGAYFNLEDEKDYVILRYTTIFGAETLDFIDPEITDYNTSFIFYKSILPGINMQNTITGDWQLFNSYIKSDIRIADNNRIGDIEIRKNSQIGDIEIRKNSQSGHIMIQDNSQSGHIRIYENSQIKNISLYKNSKSGYISINKNSRSDDINIEENCQVETISISSNSKCRNIWIKDSSQSEYISIGRNSQSESINIGRNSQSKSINIELNCQCGDIRIYGNCQIEDIEIKGNSHSGNIYISNSSSTSLNVTGNYTSLALFNATITFMKFSECCIPELTWQAGTRGELYISACKINNLNLEHTALLKDALISITDSQLFIVQLNKLTVQGQVLLTNLKHLEKPFNYEPLLKKHLAEEKPGDDASELMKSIYQSKIKLLMQQEEKYNKEKENLLKNVSNKPLWRMASSSLGKTEITGCNLTGFVFEYRDSKLLDTFISGTKLPKEKIDIYNADPKTKLDDVDFFEQKISVYSQLKKIFENQGNIVEATWYNAKAMDNQHRLLQLNYSEANKKWFSEEGFDLFNFKINKWTNNHGESWRKALWFVLISSFIVYSLYFISINYHKDFSFTGTGDFIGRFFSFLNFTRREDFMVEKEELNAFSYFFDYLGRVVTGFGIYQLIAAFRRHGRR